MNASELAKKMLEWELKYRELDILEQAINLTVLEIGKTQTVGSVRATYSKGRAKYDYEMPGQQAPQEIINNHSHSTIDIDWMEVAKDADYTTEMREKHTIKIVHTEWQKVCKDSEIEPLIISQGEPKVKVKLLD
jgi:hypothetical protein